MPRDLSKQVPLVTLNDGVQMPLLGFGTSGLRLAPGAPPDGTQNGAYQAIRHAIRCGYRFFDTAALYENEQLLGRALNDAMREGLVQRSELFVCTKLWNSAHKRRSVVRACRDSLRRLGLAYVDLYLIHWPCAYADCYEPEPGLALRQPADWINPRRSDTGRLAYSGTHFTETWLGMQDALEARLTRSIGLSNFNCAMIDQLYAMAGFKRAPSVNQVELHPYLSQPGLAAQARAKGILLNAYCPLGAPGAAWLPAGQPKVIEEPLIGELAAKRNKTAAQIILKYHLQRGVAPIPKSATPARIEENICLFDFELEAGELERMLALNRNMRYCVNTAGELIDDHPLYPFREPPL